MWQFAPVCDDADRWLDGWPSPPDRSARIAALVGGYRLSADRADELADMVVEVIAGCTRAVVRKIAAGIPAFIHMEREGILATLDSQHRVATQLRPLVAQGRRWRQCRVPFGRRVIATSPKNRACRLEVRPYGATGARIEFAAESTHLAVPDVSIPGKNVTPAVCRSRDGSGVFAATLDAWPPRRIRADVEHRMEGLHLLRNRIAHHEPIFRRDLARDHAQLLELIGWMCADSQAWATAVSRILKTIAERSG